MAMAETPRLDPVPPADGPIGGGAPTPAALSWAEQETIDALKRLARAQADLTALDQQDGLAAAPSFDGEDVARVEAIHADLVQARAKAAGRFGKAAARERASELDLTEHLVLDRMGLASYEDYLAAVRAPVVAVEPVDPQRLAFARSELAAATEAWLDVAAMTVPDPDPDSDSDSDSGPPPVSAS